MDHHTAVTTNHPSSTPATPRATVFAEHISCPFCESSLLGLEGPEDLSPLLCHLRSDLAINCRLAAKESVDLQENYTCEVCGNVSRGTCAALLHECATMSYAEPSQKAVKVVDDDLETLIHTLPPSATDELALVGDCLLLLEVGRGSQASVWFALNSRGDPHAVKIPFASRKKARMQVAAQQKAEIAILKSMREVPNIARLEGTVALPSEDEVVMSAFIFRYFRFNLGQMAGHLTPNQLAAIRGQLIGVLNNIHAKNICHGDIKPANVVTDDGTEAYLTDFGVARVFPSDAFSTKDFYGSPDYASPEAKEASVFDARSADAWALGVTMQHVANGETADQSSTNFSNVAESDDGLLTADSEARLAFLQSALH